MRRILVGIFMVWAMVAVSQPGHAQQLIESYKARLSETDHFNSKGQRLTTAAEIIRQDRANFFRFGRGDPEDEGDSYFASIENRAALERLIEQGTSESRAISRIINSTPLVRVEVFRGARGYYVNVWVLD
jgi:hypothetical protein